MRNFLDHGKHASYIMVNQGHQIASIDPTEDKSLMHNKYTREVASHEKIRLELPLQHKWSVSNQDKWDFPQERLYLKKINDA